ncbi:MAG TPA: M13 family metallopeptidase N-terminal domain-containing protein, partial [Pyrinomonadaceae bacterium]|nr:M13 family metallopeptidase N-terminal domain-containing protein [Pyrinomonadaceae bacterium]
MRKNLTNKAAALVLLAVFFSTLPVGAFGQHSEIDITGMDKSVDPGDDFFAYANGGWMRSTQIPADRTSFGAFDVIFDMVSKRTAGLITEAGKSTDPEAKMVGDYYAAYLNEDAIEKRGLEPIKAELAAIDAIKTNAQLSSTLGSQLRADVDPLNATNFYTDRLFGAFISAGFNNPTKNVPYLLQGGLGMPD